MEVRHFSVTEQDEICPSKLEKNVYSDLKKKTGSARKLSGYRGIFLVPVLSIIFEKLLKIGSHHT